MDWASQFEVIQARMDHMIIPASIGCIPYKIRSGFCSFAADQLSNWINLFSLLSLRDILTGDDLEIWRHFLLACRIFSSKSVTTEDYNIADAFLMRFFSVLSESQFSDTKYVHACSYQGVCHRLWTPHTFWAFAFERFNGIVGKQPDNNRSVELQLAKDFVCDNHQLLKSLPETYKDQFSSIIEHVVGTL